MKAGLAALTCLTFAAAPGLRAAGPDSPAQNASRCFFDNRCDPAGDPFFEFLTAASFLGFISSFFVRFKKTADLAEVLTILGKAGLKESEYKYAKNPHDRGGSYYMVRADVADARQAPFIPRLAASGLVESVEINESVNKMMSEHTTR